MSGSPDQYPAAPAPFPGTGSAESGATLTPWTSFIGREHELAQVIQLLDHPEVRLLTLTGPGGVGKTRLAVQVAAEVRGTFVHGTVIVPLAAVGDPKLIIPTLIQALGVPEVPGEPLLKRLQALLVERRLLLILDNIEQLVDAAAPVVAQLLGTCPDLTVLATSRVRLGVAGEQVLPLGTLRLEAARQLFQERAGAQGPRLALTEETPSVIDAICEKLDRLPLAIELAAARAAVLPPRALLARLEHRLSLLTGGPRDAPARQRTMRDTIGWSYDLLDSEAQRLFRRLRVFVGGFALETAAAVAGDGADVLNGLTRLVTASLVSPTAGAGDEPRFVMLETIREYALEQLGTSGEEGEVRHAHLRQLTDMAELLWTAPTSRDVYF